MRLLIYLMLQYGICITRKGWIPGPRVLAHASPE